MSDSPSTARSRRCGPVSSSRSWATGSTRSRCSPSSRRSRASSPEPLAFVFATLPNLFLSPFAGTFVDRWDRKEVLIVSDILRAAIVLLIPLAVIVNTLLVYPLVFLVTTISIFFRPARVAVLPQIVDDDELVTANSAMWIGETIADVVGFTVAGLLVAVLGTALPLAFWLDAATYLASAVLMASLVLRPAAPRDRRQTADSGVAGFFREMQEGWVFLRSEPSLLREHAPGHGRPADGRRAAGPDGRVRRADVREHPDRTARRPSGSSRRASVPATSSAVS